MKVTLSLFAACIILLGGSSSEVQRDLFHGPIHGSVIDSRGRPLPNVTVVLESLDSHEKITTVTSSGGEYKFENVPAGNYKLWFNVEGSRQPATRVISHRLKGIVCPHCPGVAEPPDSKIDVRVEAVPTVTPLPTPSPLVSPTPASTNANNHGANENANTSASNTNSGEQITPSPSPTPASKIDDILARMEFGNIAFNVPPSMSLQDAKRIELLLSLKQTEEELKQKLREEGVIPDDLHTAQIKVSDKMQAVLSGDGFQITQVTADTLPVSKQETTKWEWDVRALRAGTLHLHVVLNAIVNLGDGTGEHPYPIKTFEHTYDIKVPWGDGMVATFFKNNWQWLWITLAPLGAWIWKQTKKKRAKAGSV